MDNPFNLLVPRDDELMINESFLKELSAKIKERVKNRRFVVLEGDYGSGKSLYLKRLYKRLKTKKQMLDFTEVIITVLEGKVPEKNKSLFILNFDLMNGFNDDQVYRLSEALLKLTSEGMILLVGCRRETLKRLYEVNPLIRSKTNRLRVPSLSFDEVKELVLNRLNEVRPKSKDSLEPFSVKELKTVWRKANGNPRLIMLLLAPLYEQRMLLKE